MFCVSRFYKRIVVRAHSVILRFITSAMASNDAAAHVRKLWEDIQQDPEVKSWQLDTFDDKYFTDDCISSFITSGPYTDVEVAQTVRGHKIRVSHVFLSHVKVSILKDTFSSEFCLSTTSGIW